MRRFGALSGAMKVTYVTFFFGWLAIIGVPPFSGFWSKDEIIHAAYEGSGWQPWVFGTVALVGAGVTAFYMSRLFFMTFHGRKRWLEDVHPHESPLLMTVPMVILAIGSAGLGGLLYGTGWIESWLEPVFGPHEAEAPVMPLTVITILTLLAVAAGLAGAFLLYVRRDVPAVAPQGSFAVRAARKDLFQDDVNDIAFVEPGQAFVRGLREVEDNGISGTVRTLTRSIAGTGTGLSRLQTGFVRSYALSMVGGIVLIVAALLIVQI